MFVAVRASLCSLRKRDAEAGVGPTGRATQLSGDVMCKACVVVAAGGSQARPKAHRGELLLYYKQQAGLAACTATKSHHKAPPLAAPTTPRHRAERKGWTPVHRRHSTHAHTNTHKIDIKRHGTCTVRKGQGEAGAFDVGRRAVGPQRTGRAPFTRRACRTHPHRRTQYDNTLHAHGTPSVHAACGSRAILSSCNGT